jgi:DNA (cytosine-5)-methyltransferase 1
LQWRKLGVDGLGIADAAPDVVFPEDKLPRLTVRMVARIQSFPDEWEFTGGKTWAYRQVGNAFPCLVAKALGESITAALQRRRARMNGNHRAKAVIPIRHDAAKALRQLPFQFEPRLS